MEALRHGGSPQAAAEAAVQRIVHFYPTYVGALVVANARGDVGAACHGWTFQYSVLNSSLTEPVVIDVEPLDCPALNSIA